jgi:hypothetical protein
MTPTPLHLTRLTLGLAATALLVGGSARGADTPAPSSPAAPCQPGDEKCAEALRDAEEETWQLLLDLAFAEEETGSPLKAYDTYQRFLDATGARGAALATHWGEVRKRAEAASSRLEAVLLKSHARVTVVPRPETRTVHFFGEPLRDHPGRGPIVRFLPPGGHRVIVADPHTGRYREVSLTVTAGEARELVVELPASDVTAPSSSFAPASPAVTGPGSSPSADEGTTLLGAQAMGVARGARKQPVWRSVGAAALGVGVAATAVGAGFLAASNGLSEEAACDGLLCNLEPATRARLRSDASVAEDRAVASFVTGGLFLAGGATAIILEALGLVGPPEKGSQAASAAPRIKTIAPTFGRGGAGMSAAISF